MANHFQFYSLDIKSRFRYIFVLPYSTPMKNFIFLLFTSLIFSISALASNSNADVILGEWLSQEKDGKISIFKQGDKYYGKISWGKTPGKKDTNNPDTKLKNRDLIGLVILHDFKVTGSSWEDGKIYDPKNGKTYDCKMTILNQNQVNLRGYVLGMPFLGRNSSWTLAE